MTVPSGGLGNGHGGDLARSSCPQDCSYGFLPPAGSVHPEAFGSLMGVIGLWPSKIPVWLWESRGSGRG